MKRFLTILISMIWGTTLFGQMEVEPNDNFGTANQINYSDTIQGSINPVGDQDFYAINLPRAGVITASVSGVHPSIDMLITLYDANNNEISNLYSSPGITANYEQLVCNAGIYYLKLNDWNNDASDPQLYTLQVGLDTSDVYECNNDFNAASCINYMDTIQAAIWDEGDEDFFKISIPRAGVITASVSGVHPSIDMELSLYDANNIEISDLYSGPGLTANFDQLVCDTGTYYLKLNDWNNDAADPQLYTLTVGLDTSDVYECNNDFNTASCINYTDTIQGAIYDHGDVDFFKFTIPRAGVITASVSDVHPTIDTELTLYDENNNEISNLYSGPGITANYEQLVCNAGIYYLKLNDWNNDVSNPQLYTLEIGLDTSDIYECNNDFLSASTINYNDTIQAAIWDDGDLDYYQINIPRAGVITATVSFIHPDIDMELTLYDVNNNEISDLYSGFGVTANFEQLVCDAGIYYLKLNDWNNDASNSQLYTLMVGFDTTDVYECNNDFLSATLLPFCDSIQGTIYSIGDVDYFRFSGNANDSLSLKVANVASDLNLQVTLFDDFQNSLMSNSWNLGQPVLYPMILPATGDYFIRLEDGQNNSSSSLPYDLILENACPSTGISSIPNEELTFYPNPVRDKFVIDLTEFSTPQKNLRLKIFDMEGREIIKMDGITVTGASLEIPFSEVQPGIYVIQVITDDGLNWVGKIRKL